MFDIRDAEVLQVVARCEGFRAAAAELFISQSAVSMRVSALEERLGFRIFDRRHRRTRPTPEGRAFLDQTVRLIKLRDEIVADFGRKARFMGTIRIGVVETVVHTWLTDMLTRLRDVFDMRLELSVDTSPSIARKLVEDKVDVAVMMRELVPEGALGTTVFSCDLAYYASPGLKLPDGALGLADLVTHPIVTFPKETIPYKEFEKLLSGTSLHAPLLHGCASLSTALHLVEDGFGIGLLPVPMCERAVDSGRLFRIPTERSAALPELVFSICHMPNQPRTLMEDIRDAAVAAAEQASTMAAS